MLRTKQFEFNRKGQVTAFEQINAQRVIKICTMHARRKKTKKPCEWRIVPTLTRD